MGHPQLQKCLQKTKVGHASRGSFPRCHCTLISCYLSFDEQNKRLACGRQFLPDWIARKLRLTRGSIRNGFQNISPSLWTAMGAGRANAIFRELPATAQG
jgi:hypothetical protein